MLSFNCIVKYTVNLTVTAADGCTITTASACLCACDQSYTSFFFCHRLDQPTEVRLGIYVNSFYSISEQTMVCKHWIERFIPCLRVPPTQFASRSSSSVCLLNFVRIIVHSSVCRRCSVWRPSAVGQLSPTVGCSLLGQLVSRSFGRSSEGRDKTPPGAAAVVPARFRVRPLLGELRDCMSRPTWGALCKLNLIPCWRRRNRTASRSHRRPQAVGRISVCFNWCGCCGCGCCNWW